MALRRHNGQGLVHPERRTVGRVPSAHPEGVSWIFTPRFNKRTMGTDGHPIRSFLFIETLRRTIFTGMGMSINFSSSPWVTTFLLTTSNPHNKVKYNPKMFKRKLHNYWIFIWKSLLGFYVNLVNAKWMPMTQSNPFYIFYIALKTNKKCQPVYIYSVYPIIVNNRSLSKYTECTFE